MNCPNCGLRLEPGTVFCPSCGRKIIESPPPESPSVHCPNCFAPIAPDATVCPSCGIPLPQPSRYDAPPHILRPPVEPPRSRLVAAFLALFFGIFALDDFYLGDTAIAVVRCVISCFTWGVGGALWGFVNAIKLLTYKKNTDAQGRGLKDFPF